nr:uncharacterized protein C6orf226 homolog [Chanos chanos]
MESVYERFDSYDFESNASFQRGLSTISNLGDNPEETLKLKMFFYNRFIEPIDLEGYKQWQTCQAPISSSVRQDPSAEVGQNQSCLDINRDNIDPSSEHCKGEQASSPLNSDTQSLPEASLSFVEVFRMIQAGEEVPGLKKLDIKPNHQTPTASQKSRKLKPWEK